MLHTRFLLVTTTQRSLMAIIKLRMSSLESLGSTVAVVTTALESSFSDDEPGSAKEQTIDAVSAVLFAAHRYPPILGVQLPLRGDRRGRSTR